MDKKCSYCDGTGERYSAPCPTCGGKGYVSVPTSKKRKCAYCDGTGDRFSAPCKVCGGTGYA